MGDEVDAFGRSIQSRLGPRNESGRERAHSGGRDRGYSGGGGGRDRGHDRGGGGRRGGNDRRRAPVSLPPPLRSFKSFVLTIREDIDPKDYERDYRRYQINYVDEFSNAFFHISKTEEWFQEKYNPATIMVREDANKMWAADESLEFKEQIMENPVLAISSLRLGPEQSDDPASVEALSKANELIVETKEKEDNEEVVETPSADIVRPTAFTKGLRSVSGHDDRIVYITKIHACCTRSLFASTVEEGLSEGGISVPEKIVVGQPTWVTPRDSNGREYNARFEKCAWLTFATAAEAQASVKILRDLKFPVPSKIDKDKGEPTLLFHFSAQADMFECGEMATDKVYRNQDKSHVSTRVSYDLHYAMTIATILDTQKEVPEDSTLASILEESNVVDFLATGESVGTDKLDVVIAYLRRVHFVCFYRGKRFHDEADMLKRCPQVVTRVNAYEVDETNDLAVKEDVEAMIAGLPSPIGQTPGERESNGTADADGGYEGNGGEEETAVVADADNEKEAAPVEEKEEEKDAKEEGDGENDNRKRSFSEVDAGDGDGDNDANKGDSTPSKKDTSNGLTPLGYRKVHVPGISLSKTVGYYLWDRRSLELIKSINGENRRHLETKERDAKDGETVTKAQEDTLTALLERRCKTEGEGKARCCFVDCGKLFKNFDFLKKHMKSKHELFAVDELTADAESYMMSRYEAEDIRDR